ARADSLEVEADDMRARCQRDIPRGNGRPRLPSAGIGHIDRSRSVDTVDLDMEPSSGAEIRDAYRERIGGRRGDANRVFQPLVSLHLPDVVAPAGVGRCLDVDVCRSIGAKRIAGRRVEVADALSAAVEVLCLDFSGNRVRRCAIRRAAAGGGGSRGGEAPDRATGLLSGPFLERTIDDLPEIGRAGLQVVDLVVL